MECRGPMDVGIVRPIRSERSLDGVPVCLLRHPESIPHILRADAG
jgi:hypothetical protein